jgi:hypothetical protein
MRSNSSSTSLFSETEMMTLYGTMISAATAAEN